MAPRKWAMRPILPTAIAALYLAGGQLCARAQTFEEPRFAFVLRTPPGFTGSKSVEGGVSTWKLRSDKSGAALGENELVSVTVSALPRTAGRDPQEEFRGYADAFASQILHGGAVDDFRSARFAGHEGFVAGARGSLDLGAGKRPAVARLLLMEVDNNHVIVSAIALGGGDKAYAEVGTPNGIFAPAELMITAAPSAQSSENAKAQQPRPTGPLLKAEISNIDAVQNGPRAVTEIRLQQPVFIRSLRTYHWNNGRGAPPGVMRLVGGDGREIGSWKARGEPGQGGAPNAYWVASVNQTIGPGSYVLRTSSDATWSTNVGAGWRGFYTIEYQRVEPAPLQSAPETFDAARAKFDAFMRTRDSSAWKAAADAARTFADANPQKVEGWRLLARIYAASPAEQFAEPDSTVRALEHVIALDPKDAAARMSLAALLIKRNAFEAAIDQVEAALAVKPELATPAVLRDTARLYARAGLSERGLAFFADFSKRHRDVRSVPLAQAILLKEAGRVAEALLLVRKIANDPGSPIADAAEARKLMDAWL